MPELLIHKKTKTVFQSIASNRTKYKTNAGAIFPIHECDKWEENFPAIAETMPPKIGQVIAHGEHLFKVLNLSRDKESQKGKVWYEWNPETKTGQFHWYDDCKLVEDVIDKWVELIAFTRHNYKEDTPEYRHYLSLVPELIRDLCVVRSFNKILGTMPLGEEGELF